MPRLTHDQYFLEMAELVARRSTCIRRAVGAIIVDREHRVLSTGYNGVPRNLDHCTERACPGAGDPKGDTSRCEAVHAEVNAVLQCNAIRYAHTIYVSCTPCFVCAKMIANTEIKRVVVMEPYADVKGAMILKRASITVEFIPRA